MTCRHLVPAEEAVDLDDRNRETKTTVLLCNWADTAPRQLINVPRWMSRAAIVADLWRPGDCDGCPCHEPPL